MVPQWILLLAEGKLGARTRLGEAEHGHGEVGEAAAVFLNSIQSTLDLEEFQGDGTGDKGGGGGDGGNDLSRDFLDCVAVGGGDAITSHYCIELNVLFSTEVGAGSDEVNVVVRIIVLFEFSRNGLGSRVCVRERDFQESERVREWDFQESECEREWDFQESDDESLLLDGDMAGQLIKKALDNLIGAGGIYL